MDAILDTVPQLWQARRNCLLAGRQRVATILPTGISFLAFQRLILYLFSSNQAQFFRREANIQGRFSTSKMGLFSHPPLKRQSPLRNK